MAGQDLPPGIARGSGLETPVFDVHSAAKRLPWRRSQARGLELERSAISGRHRRSSWGRAPCIGTQEKSLGFFRPASLQCHSRPTAYRTVTSKPLRKHPPLWCTSPYPPRGLANFARPCTESQPSIERGPEARCCWRNQAPFSGSAASAAALTGLKTRMHKAPQPKFSRCLMSFPKVRRLMPGLCLSCVLS